MRAAACLVVFALAACGDTPARQRPLSYLALRYEATVPQGFDYTCGAASLATVMSFYWDRPTGESEVIDALQRRYSLAELAKRRETGLSFDDLIFAANQLGFKAEGAHSSAAELRQLEGPVIVHLDKGKFQHFVVLRRVGDGVYYISDPVVGGIAMSRAEFETQFSGNLLAVWREGAALPRGAILARPRDGISVRNSIQGVIDAAPMPGRPIL